MNLLILVAISVVLIAGVEFIKRRFRLSSDITRRFIHVGAALIAAAAPLFVGQTAIIAVCIFFAAVLLFARHSSTFSAIQDVKRTTFGDVYLPLGEALAAFFFLPTHVEAFQFGVLVMGISDPAAGLVGEAVGRHRIKVFNQAKSVEGSLAFFVSAVALTFLFLPDFGVLTIVIPLILTLIELCLIYGLDNLVLPSAGAFLIQYLFH